MVAHRTFNPLVPGSTPGCSTKRREKVLEFFAVCCLSFVLWLGLVDAVKICDEKHRKKKDKDK